jgi:putative MATE family efflux protein
VYIAALILIHFGVLTMRDLTRGPIVNTLISLALPTAAGMLFQTLYLLVDLYFVAALGESSVAGVGAAGTIMFMVMAFTQVLGVSTVAIMSQAVGRKEQDVANHTFNQSMSMGLLMAAVTFLVGMLGAESYMSIIAADAPTQEEGVRFLYFFIPGMALQFILIGMGSALRATGIVKPGMIIQIITVLLNTVMAWALIPGRGPIPALGVVGAGLSSTLSVAAGVILLVYYFFKLERYVKIETKHWVPDFAVWRRLVLIGLPAGGEMLLMFIYMGLVYVLIQDFGAEAQAGFSVGGRIMQSIFMPTMAIGFAIGPMVGQNFGAGHPERIHEIFRKGLLISALVMVVATIILQINPYLLVTFFTDQQSVVQVGGEFLKLISLNFIAQGIIFACSGMFQGIGNTKPAMLSSGFRLLIFTPLAFFMSSRENFVIHDVWYVSVLTVWIQSFVSVWLVRRELKIKLSSFMNYAKDNDLGTNN